MNWDRCLILVGQIVAVAVLGSLVALGHDSSVTNGLLATCGILVGTSLYQATGSRKNTQGD